MKMPKEDASSLQPVIPARLKKGDHLRVIAPAESFSPKFTKDLEEKTLRGFKELGLQVSFGKYVHEMNSFKSASVEHRLEDLHEAFEDASVNAIISAIGGSSANQLLKHMNYELIRDNPKIFCGLSDITELNSAIYSRTGLVTYYGPHFTMLGASQFFPQMLSNMKEIFFSEEPVEILPSEHYSNTEWEDDKIRNPGYWTINPGKAEAQCMGGNLLTLNFLMGYNFMPDFEGRILFLEENKIIDYRGIQKEVQQIMNHPSGSKLRGIIFGRFQRESKMKRKHLEEMFLKMEELHKIPVVANVDCSHTAPMMTFPFGGKISMEAQQGDRISLIITEH
ncbi:LD-carboxypeptidase [Salinimicrobium tongyeongense]|uniref:LD-carboxypeptidase n=1 Tax=Salinimicrobium tongyeongense TaxID=2809707 RepID=A0ABY6NRL7_9FLAO|nr:S66 peptidase family protein [Salinimicrobium tongyeongense]UZH55478.1 LD-carboxypeptidase [Salinimicrobium tongyeongense]